MFSINNQIKLKSLARKPMINGKINPEFGKENAPLNAFIAQLMAEESHQFLTHNDLPNRVFVDEPASAVTCKGFIRPIVRLAYKG
jgi:hypothetical protein